MLKLRCSFDTYLFGDMYVMVVDRDEPMSCSVTNDADSVIRWLGRNLNGGIGNRRVVYRDTDGRFDELLVNNGDFGGFRALTASQQAHFSSTLSSRVPL